jgi:chromosomal replication initiation ATPase DnaA
LIILNNIGFSIPYPSVKPTSNAVGWDLPSSSSKTIRLNPQYAKSSSTDFHFDELITGSENKPVYNKVARKHVISAMEGYNAVVFAYGQTASGKTFTLVSPTPATFPPQECIVALNALSP